MTEGGYSGTWRFAGAAQPFLCTEGQQTADCGRCRVSQNPADFSPKTGEHNC